LLNASLNVIQGIKGESLKLSILYGSHLMCENSLYNLKELLIKDNLDS